MNNMDLFGENKDELVLRNIKHFILNYKRDMRDVRVKNEAIIEILAKRNLADKKYYYKLHNGILKKSLNKLYDEYDMQEVFSNMFPVYTIITSMNKGIDCSIFFEDDLSNDALAIYVTELTLGRNIALYANTSFDSDTIRRLSDAIYNEKIFDKQILEVSTPMGLANLYYLHHAYIDIFNSTNLINIADLKYVVSIDAIADVPQIVELLQYIRYSKFKDLTILLFADIVESINEQEYGKFKELIRIYGKAEKYLDIIDSCFELIIRANIKLNHLRSKYLKSMLLDLSIYVVDKENRRKLRDFILKIKQDS